MKLGGIILTLIMSAYLLRPVIPFVEYALNKDYIAKVLCINKDEPELKCNGMCHLNKQLKEQTKEEQNPEAPFRILEENIQLWHNVLKLFSNQSLIQKAEKSFKRYTLTYKFTPYVFFFHPPD